MKSDEKEGSGLDGCSGLGQGLGACGLVWAHVSRPVENTL